MPLPISGCHSWRFDRKKKNRASVFGRGINCYTATNVSAKCCMVPDEIATDRAKFFTPEVDPFDVLVVPAVVEEEAELLPSGQPVKEEGGWKISYRTEFPELATIATARARLGRKLRCYKDVDLVEGQRRMPLSVRRARAKASGEKHKIQQKQVVAQSKKRKALD